MIALNEFMQFHDEALAVGQRHLADAMRALLYKAAPDIFEYFADADDDVFLEPLLFAYFARQNSHITLQQILLGYVAADDQPELTEVYADANGIVYLPQIGYFATEVRSRTLALKNLGTSGWAIFDGDARVGHVFLDIWTIPGTNIEILCHCNPLLESVLLESTANAADFRPLAPDQIGKQIPHIERALAVIRAQWPEYYDALCRTVRQIVMFESKSLNSCAAVATHGVALFNIGEAVDEVYFIDELLHQGGHVVFNAITVQRRDFLTGDPDSPMVEADGFAHRRSVYTVLHGAYTEFAMMEGMRRCEENCLLSGRKAHELVGRLSCISQKAAIDLEHLRRVDAFTEKGDWLYGALASGFERTRMARPDLLSRYDMSNQPYNFSYEQFARLNPLPSEGTSRGR